MNHAYRVAAFLLSSTPTGVSKALAGLEGLICYPVRREVFQIPYIPRPSSPYDIAGLVVIFGLMGLAYWYYRKTIRTNLLERLRNKARRRERLRNKGRSSSSPPE